MAGSINKAIIVGNVGANPDIRVTQSGDKIASLSVATSESWKDKNTGDKREKTEWHRVVIFNQALIPVIEQYVKKGDKLYIEGMIQTRKWEQDGVDRYTTEIVIKPYNGVFTMLSSRGSGGPPPASSPDDYEQSSFAQNQTATPPTSSTPPADGFEDEIPF